MPTVSRLIEGVSPQNATLQGGRLGNQAGAVRVRDDVSELPKKADEQVPAVIKNSDSTQTQVRQSVELNEKQGKHDNAIINLLYKVRAGKELPGVKGVKLSRRPTPAELEGLSAKHGVEFAVIYKLGAGKGGGGGQYYLYSGRPRRVDFPVSPDSILIYHTHPGGTAYASPADMQVLKILQSIGSPQNSSQIVPAGKDVVRFSKDRSRF
jgi:hypothetical protein